MTVWEFLLAAGLAYRVTRLVGWDDLTEPLRRRLTGLSDRDHEQTAQTIQTIRDDGDEPWGEHAYDWSPPLSPLRWYVSELVRCPWCAGFWISLLAVALMWQVPTEATWVAVPFTISALVGLTARNLDA